MDSIVIQFWTNLILLKKEKWRYKTIFNILTEKCEKILILYIYQIMLIFENKIWLMVVCLVVTSLIILFLRDNIINYNFPNDENSITINKTDGSACIMQQNFRHIPRNTWLIPPAINHFPWQTLKYAGNCSRNDRTRRMQKTINVGIRGMLASRRGTKRSIMHLSWRGHWPMHSLHYYRTERIFLHLFESFFFPFPISYGQN